MKRVVLLFFCCAILLTAVVSAQAVSYRIRELSVDPTGAAGLSCVGMANGIGGSNRVAGVVYEGASSCAVVSNEQGELVMLDEGFALGVNASGQAVGYAGAAVLWDSAGNMSYLPLPESASFSLAHAINDAGQAVGECWMGEHNVSNYVMLWSPGADPVNLGVGCGNSINDDGAVAGTTRDGDNARRAFVWTASAGITPLAGGLASEATAINDLGVVAGTLTDAIGTWACVWDAIGNSTILQCLPGTLSSSASAINNSGAIVGSCNTATGSFAVLWQADGSMTCLGELPGHASSLAYGISDSGWIVGCSLDCDGLPHPVVWELIPEPSSVLALVVGLVGLIPVLRRR